jgi:hypothetical protein
VSAAELTAVVRRWAGGASAGHNGIAYYASNDAPTGGAIDPQVILGRRLNDGTVIRVTVEVIAESDTVTTNPWHGGRTVSALRACNGCVEDAHAEALAIEEPPHV